MAKKKKKVSTTQKVEQKETTPSFIPKDKNAIINMAIFLMIGLIVGALIMYWAGVLPNQGGNDANNIINKSGTNVNELSLKVQGYLNDYLLMDDSVSAFIVDVSEFDDGVYQLEFEIKEGSNLVGNGFVFSTNDILFLGQAFNLNEPLELPDFDNDDEPEQVEFQKREVADAELFIWSYCPYGVTALEPFAEVASNLNNKANMEVVLYYGGHGDYEVHQNKIQACLQEQGNEKYWDYAKAFVEQVYPVCANSRTVDCDKQESTKVMNALGIDSSKVFECVEADGQTLIDLHAMRARSLGVTGSPTIVVNDVLMKTVSRTASGYLNAVCGGFINAPSECSAQLSDSSATVNGSC